MRSWIVCLIRTSLTSPSFTVYWNRNLSQGPEPEKWQAISGLQVPTHASYTNDEYHMYEIRSASEDCLVSMCFNRGSRFVDKTSSKNPEVRRYFLNLWFSFSGLCATNDFIHITFKISGFTWGWVGLQGFSGPQEVPSSNAQVGYSICHWDYCPKGLDQRNCEI